MTKNLAVVGVGIVVVVVLAKTFLLHSIIIQSHEISMLILKLNNLELPKRVNYKICKIFGSAFNKTEI